jgi:serine/threonine-protein kinase
MESFINKIVAKRYHCIKQIGAGGMGLVYLAEDRSLNRSVVLKILNPSHKDDKDTSRFLREAKILSQLNHPHIVTIHDFGIWKKNMYIVLEYLQGDNLQQLIEEGGPRSPAWVLHVLPQILDALEAAHHEGVIHRDLKPSNIFYQKRSDHNDTIKILDFGTALYLDHDTYDKITTPGEVIGTPHYMSPEQIMGKEASTCSDIYSLGVVLYEMLSGDAPFTGENRISILLAHLYKPPKPIILGKGEDDQQYPKLLEIVNTCLNKNPEDRYASIHELRKTLTEELKSPARLPENLVGDRQLRFKQFYQGPVEDSLIEAKTSTIMPVLNRDLLVIEADNLPIENSITPLLKITNHTIRSPIALEWDKIKKMKLPEAVILNKGKDENMVIIQQIQSFKNWGNIPVFICGPEGDLEYISLAIDAGAGDYLSYPFDPREIIKKIDRLYQDPNHNRSP